MESEFLTKILELYNLNNWEKILNLNENSDNEEALRILWVWPSIKNLEFIKETIQKNECTGIISLGCGCGLLEWIIQQSTGNNKKKVFFNLLIICTCKYMLCFLLHLKKEFVYFSLLSICLILKVKVI